MDTIFTFVYFLLCLTTSTLAYLLGYVKDTYEGSRINEVVTFIMCFVFAPILLPFVCAHLIYLVFYYYLKALDRFIHFIKNFGI